MDIIDAATKGELAVVLAIGLVALAGVVAFLFRTILKVYEERVKRAESLTDKMVETFDGLEQATQTAVAIARDNADIAKQAADLAQKSLDELRRR
jgi:hypothetical protein